MDSGAQFTHTHMHTRMTHSLFTVKSLGRDESGVKTYMGCSAHGEHFTVRKKVGALIDVS